MLRSTAVPDELKFCKQADIERLKGMYQQKDLLKLTDRQGASCAHYAARARSPSVLEYVKEAAGGCADEVFSAKSNTGSSALHDACAAGEL